MNNISIQKISYEDAEAIFSGQTVSKHFLYLLLKDFPQLNDKFPEIVAKYNLEIYANTIKELEKLYCRMSVMEAYIRGEEIQVSDGTTWFDCEDPTWYPQLNYRVKP